MQRFEMLAQKHSARIERIPLAWDVGMHLSPSGPLISYCDSLRYDQASMGVSLMFACLELEWTHQVYRMRFATASAPPISVQYQHEDRRDFRHPLRLARQILIPDSFADLVLFGNCTPEALAQRLAVPIPDVYARLAERRATLGGHLPFF